MGVGAKYEICTDDTTNGCSNPDILNLNALNHLEYFGVKLGSLCPNPDPFGIFK
jgi:hypothetical protein